MNYEPNTTHWKRDDVVIHEADRKHEDMLMKVIGYTRDGLCKTRYIHPGVGSKHICKNELRFLHDPERFGIPKSKTE